jgi:hypothetical protein
MGGWTEKHRAEPLSREEVSTQLEDKMKTNRVSRIIVLVFCVLALSAATASAQNSNVMKVTVPFEFKVQKDTLPAGTYVVERVYAAGNRVLLLQGGPRLLAKFINSSEIQSVAGSMTPALVFHRYGDTYVLASVLSVNSRFVLPLSRVEKDLLSQMANTQRKPEMVTIGSRTRD